MGFYCDGCGRGQRRNNPPDVSPYDLQVHRRPNGDEHWLCTSCQPSAYGSVPVDVVQQVADDRERHAGVRAAAVAAAAIGASIIDIKTDRRNP